MFTESELRDALRHSAARADALPGARPRSAAPPVPSDAGTEVVRLAVVSSATGRWRRMVAPIAAAAAVVAAVTVGSVLVTGSDRPSGDQVASGSQAGSPSPAAPPASVPSTAVDLVSVTAPGVVNNEIGSTDNTWLGSQTVRRVLGAADSMTLTVVPGTAPYFDANRIPRDRPVPIAGTTGYYSKLKLFPLDANTEPGHDKWLAHWTIAFMTPSGDWAFAWIEQAMTTEDQKDASVDDPARIAAEYAALGATFTPNTARLPFRLGYVPAGLRFANAALDTGVPAPGFASLHLVDGEKSVHLQLVSADSGLGEGLCPAARGEAAVQLAPPAKGETSAPIVANGGPTGDCGSHLRRPVGDHILVLDVKGYAEEEARRVLDAIEVASDLADRSTFFPLPS
jgi:hypothetical protein